MKGEGRGRGEGRIILGWSILKKLALKVVVARYGPGLSWVRVYGGMWASKEKGIYMYE